MICANRPAFEVMELVAEALFMNWSYDKRADTWRLELSGKVRQEETAARKKEQDRELLLIRSALVSMQRWAGMSREEQALESRAIRDRLASAEKAEGPDSQRELVDAQVQADLLRLQACSGFGAAWKDRLDEAVTRPASGETLLASSRPDDEVPRVPQSSVPETTFQTTDPVGVVFMVRYLQGQSVLEGRGLLTGFKAGGMTAPFHVRLRPLSTMSDLDRRLDQWGEILDADVLSREIDSARARITREGFVVQGFSNRDGDQHLDQRESAAHSRTYFLSSDTFGTTNRVDLQPQIVGPVEPLDPPTRGLRPLPCPFGLHTRVRV